MASYFYVESRTNTCKVSFPGGMEDASDENPIMTALRETNEELGIHNSNIEVLGKLHEVLSSTNIIGMLPQ